MTDIKAGLKVFASQEEIYKRLKLVASQIELDYCDSEIELVYSSTGASLFIVDLARMINLPTNVHQILYKSYVPPSKSGEVQFLLDVSKPLQGKNVILVDGIIVSGKTPLYVIEILKQRKPASLELCVVGSKSAELTVDLNIKYQLFSLGSEWIEGYGIGSGANKFANYLLDIS